VELLESSFKAITPKAGELADTFYDQLFRDHPEVKPLFEKADMADQKKALIGALALIVANLRNPEALEGAVKGLAGRHIDYGVQREQYPVVGQTLLDSLARVAGDMWNKELHDAWAEAYGAIQGIVYTTLNEQAKDAA